MHAGFRERVHQRRPDIFTKNSRSARSQVLPDELFGAFDDVLSCLKQCQARFVREKGQVGGSAFQADGKVAEHLRVFRLVIKDPGKSFARSECFKDLGRETEAVAAVFA